jgi:hypothetical protein
MAGSWRSDAWRLRALRAALLLVSLLAVDASARPEPLRPSTAVVRLGSAHGYLTIAGVTKGTVAPPSTAPVEIELGDLSAGRLDVAAGVVEFPTVDRDPRPAAVRCSARVSGSHEVGTDLELEGDRWVARSMAITETRRGDRLVMTCGGASGTTTPVVWARPLFVPASNGSAPLVIIVSLDTLRADYVSGFGAASGATPALERLGREGIRFTETMAEATWTIPSHFALFYGRLYGFPAMQPPLRGLAQLLSDNGWVTAAFTGGGFMGAFFRFHLGFDHFAEYDAAEFGGSDVRSLPQVLDDAERWMTTFSDVPLALFVHTYAVHELTPWERTGFDTRADLLEQFDPSPAQVAAARRLYDELVPKTDAILGPFFERLRAVAAERPLLLIVLSDHGEAFWEHRNYRHGDAGPRVTLHDEVTRVPLIVWGPRLVAEDVVSRRPRMLSDVAPSILAAAGIPRPATMVGRDLWSSWSAATANADDRAGGGAPSVSRGARGWALRSRSYKLIAQQVAGTPTRFELYDLRRDPHERKNLASRHPRAVEALRWRLTRRVAALTGTAMAPDLPVCPLCQYGEMEAFWDGALMQAAGGDASAIGAATRERLRALGYADH